MDVTLIIFTIVNLLSGLLLFIKKNIINKIAYFLIIFTSISLSIIKGMTQLMVIPIFILIIGEIFFKIRKSVRTKNTYLTPRSKKTLLLIRITLITLFTLLYGRMMYSSGPTLEFVQKNKFESDAIYLSLFIIYVIFEMFGNRKKWNF